MQRPLRGGCRAAVSSVCLRPLLGLKGRGGGSGGGPLVPWRRPLTAEGGRPGGPGPRGQPSAGGSHSSPAPLYLESDPRAGARRGPSFPPPSSRGAGRPGAAVTVSGQRLAGCGAVGSPPRLLSPPSLPREVARAPLSRRIVGGAWVGGPSSPPPFFASAVWAVTCAAACVGAGAVAAAGCATVRQWARALRKARGSQLLASASVMRSTAPPSRKAGHVGPLSGHAARITDLRTLSWSSGATWPPGGTSWFPPSLQRSTASKGWFLNPLVVPWLAQLNHPYTSPTRGRASSPRGFGTVPQSRSQGRAPSAPRAGSPCCPCACGAGAAPRPPPPRPSAPAPLSVRGCWLVLGSWGLGGDELAGVGVDVVEVVVLGLVVVVVVSVVRRHLLNAGGGATHRLHVRLRGRPAPRPLPFQPPSPPGSHAQSCLSLGARGALALALGPPSSPLPVPRVPPPVTHAMACPLAHRPSPRSMHLGALPAHLRALPVPWPLPGSLP